MPMSGSELPDEATLGLASTRVEGLLQAARPPLTGNVVLSQARVADRLFGGNNAGLGRFRVLDQLGRGGMGVVYAAYDPQLDRSVALKTVHVPQLGRELALQEAKALAKLSHPNIVPVFDVGFEADQVYIVMELVRGHTLREWVVGKDLRAIIDAYRQAGEALAAAHEAKLVHRDFKPDNAIVGTDGRVRVVDFGLACEAPEPGPIDSAPTRSAAGTPKYMAPEQRIRGVITAAADQYSFSISLAEALRPPWPSWIEAIIARGCAERSTDRFASMRHLLRALGQDPAQLRRRRIAFAVTIGAVATVAASAVVVARSTIGPEPCRLGERELQATWSSSAQQVAVARIAALSPYGRSLAEPFGQQWTDYRARWMSGHRDTCLANRAGELSTRVFERRMACFDQSRVALGTVAHIATHAVADDLPDLANAATAIPDPDACRHLAALGSDVEPPASLIAAEVSHHRDALARARVQIAGARYAEARAIAARSIQTARALAYRPLLAEALLVAGHVALETSDRAHGIGELREATALGLEIRNDDLAVEAWARRAWLEGTRDVATEHALDGMEVMIALAQRSTAAFPRALLYNNIGSIELGRSHREAAKAAFERAVVEARGIMVVLRLVVRRKLPPLSLPLSAPNADSCVLDDFLIT